MATSPGREFRVGGVLSNAFSIFFRNLLPFGFLALVVSLPVFVLRLVLTETDPTALAAQAQAFTPTLILSVLQFLLSYLVTAGLVYGTIQDLRGQRATIGQCLARGLAVLIPTFVVAILVGLMVVLGLVLMIVPGIIVVLMLWVAIPVAVIERPGVFRSLGRSRELTKGSRWKLLGVTLVVAVASFASSWVVGVALAPVGNMVVSAVGNLVVEAAFSALWAVTSAVSYYALRTAKEGVDIEEIAAVFA